MTTLTFLIDLSGATLLLLFAVRMLQPGVDRLVGPSLRRLVTRHRQSRLQTAGAGLWLAIVLQSATAAGLLAASFVTSEVMSFVGGLAIVLGADLGSALVIQLLSFRPEWLIPVLLTLGGYLFLKAQGHSSRQVGRIFLGIAFILLSLRFISEAVHPIRDSNFMPAIAGYLEGDFATAFLVGAATTFVMHSSVAAILMTVTFVVIGVLPVTAGVSVVLGANLGSAVLLVWLSRGMPNPARRVPLGNLVLRGAGAILLLLVLGFVPAANFFTSLGIGPGQTLVFSHLLFNAVLLVVSLPFISLLEAPLAAVLRDGTATEKNRDLKPVSALDRGVLHRPGLAIASLTREVLRMSETVEMMAKPVMQFYRSGDLEGIATVRAKDDEVNAALNDVRRYVASIPRENLAKDQSRRIRELVEYSINLETAGDIICKNLLTLAVEKKKNQLRFSDAGWAELQSLHERVMANMALAFNVLVSEDIESARLLLEAKAEMAVRERKSRKRHLKRLRQGAETSFESSDVHLETLRALKDLNAQVAAIAYPILYRNGQLLETRLVETLDPEDQGDNK